MLLHIGLDHLGLNSYQTPLVEQGEDTICSQK